MVQKWEYKTRIRTNQSLAEFLLIGKDTSDLDRSIKTIHNELGEDGCELVSHFSYSSLEKDSTMYAYKRFEKYG